jgi:hypothetical protein
LTVSSVRSTSGVSGQIEKSVCARQHHDDRDTECRQVLLVLELAVNREEGVEFALGEP